MIVSTIALCSMISFFPILAEAETTAAAEISQIAVSEATASRVVITDTAYTIYGGYAGTGGTCGTTATPDNANVCDSCKGLGTLGTMTNYSCAYRSIYPDLVLSISFVVTNIPANSSLRAEISGGSTTGTMITLESSSTDISSGTTLTANMKWSALCTSTACTTSEVRVLKVGVTNGATSDFLTGGYKEFTVRIRYADPSTNNKVLTCATGDPFCEIKVFPGDGKVYVQNISRGSTGPYGDASEAKWRSLRLFYDETNLPGADFDSIPVGTDANYADLEVLSNESIGDISLASNKITGLTNETSYKFTAASVDDATVVTGFWDSSIQNETDHTATPGEVVGLLDNKKCFIATAAFGSQMAPQVDLLRQFRNQFLLTHSWGVWFVKFYYRTSPPIAEFISQHDTLRTVIRTLLWPLIVFAQSAMQFGMLVTLGIILALATMLSLLIPRIFTRRVSK